MKTIARKLYEAMFLVDSAEAAANWDGVNTAIRNILERAGAEVVSIRKWDDRKLAYEINGKAKGTYILCYFRAEGEKIREIERDVQLSEQIMRVLILCAEHISHQDIEKEPILQKGRKVGTEKDTSIIRAEKHKQKAVKAVVEQAGGSEQPAAKEAKAEEAESEQEEIEDFEQADKAERGV